MDGKSQKTDKSLIPFEIPLDGRLRTEEDPLMIGKDFQTLKNLRYMETTKKGIGGIAKINSTALTYTA